MPVPADRASPQPEERKKASAELIPLVYEELRRVAHAKMRRGDGAYTLTATALVHEAFLKVSHGEESGRWVDERHFFSAAAEAMRRILIDRARQRKQWKRGGNLQRDELRESAIVAPASDDDLLAVDEVLDELAAGNPEAAELVKLRTFAGLTWEEISRATGIPDRTLRRRWRYARAWLQERLAAG